MEKFNILDPFLKTLWFIAVPVSVIFLIQLISIIKGRDNRGILNRSISSGFLGNNESDSFQVWTSRNVVNFLFSFSWSGICFFSYIENIPILLLVAVLVGASFVGLYTLILKSMHIL
jgi:hypothetical protein